MECESDKFKSWRESMVLRQLRARGITDSRVLEAMKSVPRHLFVEEALRYRAYEDNPLPIGFGQTISQPYMVGVMTEKLALRETDRVLEVGTGSGYQAAILASIAKEVYTIEIIEGLYKRASLLLPRLGYSNVHCKLGDGTCGWGEHAPYDRIIVTAGAPKVPSESDPLWTQLVDGGVMVIPVGSRDFQELYVVRKEWGRQSILEVCSCVFVPLVGKYGWGGSKEEI
ncbi:MAG: protein-L-isoaspartate(D-aspartate) O-methyltransferase [bacterium]